MKRKTANPYRAPRDAESPRRHESRSSFSWIAVPLIVLSGYYVLSSCTLPFADDVWFAEVPLLALLQLPKSLAFDWIQDQMMTWMKDAGLSSGSPSPDMMASKPWAFAVVFVIPTMVLLDIVAIGRQLKRLSRWIVLLVVTATIDAAVTIWFEKSSSLSVF